MIHFTARAAPDGERDVARRAAVVANAGAILDANAIPESAVRNAPHVLALHGPPRVSFTGGIAGQQRGLGAAERTR